MGIPGPVRHHQRGCELDCRGEHHMLPLSPGVLGRVARRQDVQALSEYLSHHWSHIYERMFALRSAQFTPGY
jgi:hypothetical protein